MSKYEGKGKDELLALCEERGVPHDKRWGEEKLGKALSSADERREESSKLTAAANERADIQNANSFECRITQMGEGRVSSGQHVPGDGDLCLPAGAVKSFPIDTARGLFLRGFAEVVKLADLKDAWAHREAQRERLASEKRKAYRKQPFDPRNP
jgi:hypothetical protein